MDTHDLALKGGYMTMKFILIPLIIAGAGIAWIYLKNKSKELSKKVEEVKKERIKSTYRKELEKKELIEKLKQEVRDEMEQEKNR